MFCGRCEDTGVVGVVPWVPPLLATLGWCQAPMVLTPERAKAEILAWARAEAGVMGLLAASVASRLGACACPWCPALSVSQLPREPATGPVQPQKRRNPASTELAGS